MNESVLIGVLIAVLAPALGYIAFITASRATRVQAQSAAKAVDAGAFERAREIYEGALETLRDELAATRSDLLSARNEIARLRDEIIRLREEISKTTG